jgi:sulfate transport system permease protein
MRARTVLIPAALVYLAFFLVLPLACVLAGAFKKGWAVYFSSLTNPEALSAIGLTLFTALICVPLNLIFGIAASWAIAKFDFKGKAKENLQINPQDLQDMTDFLKPND